jgi:hypothetical protein
MSLDVGVTRTRVKRTVGDRRHASAFRGALVAPAAASTDRVLAHGFWSPPPPFAEGPSVPPIDLALARARR